MQERTAIIAPLPRKIPLARLLGWIPVWLSRLLVWLFWIGYFSFALTLLSLRYWVLPNIEHYREDIQGGISRAAGLPVSIRQIDTHWQGLRPHLTLRGFSIHDGAGRPGLTFDTVETELSWASLWRWQLRLHRLEVDSPALNIRREKDGRIFIAGIELNTQASGNDFSDWLLSQEQIVIRNATIRWDDELRAAPTLTLDRLNFSLHNDGARHRFGLTAVPPAGLAARLDVRGDFRGSDLDRLETWKGQAYAELDYADLAGWRTWVDYPIQLPRGSGGVRLWLGFAHKHLEGLTADIALRDVRLRLAKDLPMLDLLSLYGRLSGRQLGEDGQGFEASSRKLTLATREGIELVPTDFSVRWQPGAGGKAAEGEFSANHLDMDVLTRLASFLPLDEATRQTLDRYTPQGRVDDLKLGWKGDAGALVSYALRGRFEKLGLHAQGYFPGFAGLTGTVEANEKSGVANLDSRQAAIELPAVFADSRLEFDQLKARTSWTVKNGRVEVQLQEAAFENKDAAGNASGRYLSSTTGPGEIDLSARLSRADGAAVWRYMPLAVSHEVSDWLRGAISGGRADDTRLILKGDLKNFPFTQPGQGLFQVTAKIAGARLRYAEGWPNIDDIHGDLRFEGKGMRIRADKGSIYGVAISGVEARIDDLETYDEIIHISGQAAGPTADFLRFIDTSPVTEKIDRFTEGMRAAGNGTLGLKLTIPLRRLADTVIDGQYQFAGNELTVDSDLPPLAGVNGRLHFTGNSISMKDARAQLLGAPLVINAGTRKDGAVTIAARGSLNIAELRKVYDVPLFDHLSGSAPWRATVVVNHRNADVVLESGLEGIASSLPEPFNKSTGSVLPVRFERSTLEAAAGRDQVRITLGKQVLVQLQRRREEHKPVIERGLIGINETPLLPEKGVVLAASVPAFNVDFWRAQFPAVAGKEGRLANPVTQINLKTPEMTVFDRPLHEVSLRGALIGDAWQAQVTSREVKGELTWKGAERGRLQARLKSFVLDETHQDKPAVAAEPLRELPGLDIVADEFILRGHKLGRLDLAATNTADAWKLDRLAIVNDDGSLTSDGLWRGQDTALNFKLDVRNIDKMLERLGYADAVRRGTAKLEGRLSWAGTPVQIDYATLKGELKAEAANGQFNKLDPGVGRLLGILSLQSLPRRITLDFRDIFSEGFAFDSIIGSARVTNGVLRTKNLQISGPAAKIFMAGEVSVPDETQNLTVRIEPALGESVAIGAMIANPAIGAAAWVAQKILMDPFGKIFAFEYTITGSWSDPKVEKLNPQTAARKEDSQP